MKHPSGNQPQEVLAGLVERVTYHNAQNGFCVLRAKARGHRDVVTVVGHAATIAAGEWITASGEWINDRTHGQQFKARFLRTSLPTSVDGIEKSAGESPDRVALIEEVETRVGSKQPDRGRPFGCTA
jgi:exodeoxyribonuclease V alpha subunit